MPPLLPRSAAEVQIPFAAANAIDQLSGTILNNVTVNGLSGLTAAEIPTGITASNYLLAGGTPSRRRPKPETAPEPPPSPRRHRIPNPAARTPRPGAPARGARRAPPGARPDHRPEPKGPIGRVNLSR
jgi:hypothetical protein